MKRGRSIMTPYQEKKKQQNTDFSLIFDRAMEQVNNKAHSKTNNELFIPFFLLKSDGFNSQKSQPLEKRAKEERMTKMSLKHNSTKKFWQNKMSIYDDASSKKNELKTSRYEIKRQLISQRSMRKKQCFEEKQLNFSTKKLQKKSALLNSKEIYQRTSEKVEGILRRKTIKDFDHFMSEYCKRMKIAPKSNIFIFNSQDQWIKQGFLKRGWIQNLDKYSSAFHISWTNRIIKETLYSQQLVNHFPSSDLLTSKQGFHKITKKSIQLRRSIPRTFDIKSQRQQFLSNFQQTTILCGFKKIIKKMKDSDYSLCKNVKESFLNLLQTQNFIKETRINTIIHVPFCVQICAYIQNIRCRVQREINAQIFILTEKTLKNIKRFCELEVKNPQFDFSKILEKDAKAEIYFHKKDINLYKSNCSFSHPSQELINLIFTYHDFLCCNFNTYKNEGDQNIWIIKNRNSSRGAGITLSSSSDEILKKCENHLVQKYIENCCLYVIPKNLNVKFDLRIWVLIMRFKPLRGFWYSDFYGRLCSQPYDKLKKHQLERHLTNYTLNKSFFSEYDHSILTSRNFFQYMSSKTKRPLQETKHNFEQKVNNLITLTLSQYENIIQSSDQHFQLFGFDILPSEKFDLHLLEVNLSPACSQRNKQLTKMKQKMCEGMLDIIIQKKYSPQNTEWKLLY